MTRRLADPWCGLLVLVLIASGEVFAQKTLRISESGLRGAAINVVMPVYPKESLKNKTAGVAVAQLQVTERGIVADVSVIEAPGEFAAKAVSEAVRQWVFQPIFVHGERVKVIAKLTFYFVADKNGGRVENPRTFVRRKRSS